MSEELLKESIKALKIAQNHISEYRSGAGDDVDLWDYYEKRMVEIKEALERPQLTKIRVFARIPELNTHTILASNLDSRTNATLTLDEGVKL